MQETWVQSPGEEDPLKKGMATHSSILAWRIPWTERGAWQAWVHGVVKSWTQLSNSHTHTHTQFMHIHYHIAKKNTHFLLQILIIVLKYAAPWALLYMNTEVKNQNSFLSSLDHKGILSAIFSRKEKKKNGVKMLFCHSSAWKVLSPRNKHDLLPQIFSQMSPSQWGLPPKGKL